MPSLDAIHDGVFILLSFRDEYGDDRYWVEITMTDNGALDLSLNGWEDEAVHGNPKQRCIRAERYANMEDNEAVSVAESFTDYFMEFLSAKGCALKT